MAMPALRSLLPSRHDYDGVATSWRADLVAGVTVGVVALPLALGFGVTSGLGAAAGLMTAIVAGLVAAVFGGSDVQVSGPTGAMTVVLVPVVERYGVDAVLVVGLMAGVLIVAAGLVRLGRYLAYVPWPVVEGFTVGIAVIIFLQQVPAAVGVAKPEGENTALVAWRALVDSGELSVAAAAIVVVVVVVMVGVAQVRRSLPASLVAVVAATVLAEAADLDVARIGSLPGSLPAPSMPDVGFSQLGPLASAAFAVAILGALESLLSARVADGMAGTRRHDPDRELIGQGLANLASPLFGGMPATGAIARTAVNVRAGARSRLAAVFHAVVLVGVVYLAGGVVGRIPLAALAGVLMVTAVRMVELHNVRSVWGSTRSDAAVLAVTAATTVAFDLIVAIEVGVAIAALLALREVARHASADAEPVSGLLPPMLGRLESGDGSREEDVTDAVATGDERIVTYRLEGALFFGAAQRFLTELTAVRDVDVVILRLPRLGVLDATGAHTLREIVRELEGRGVTVLLKGVRHDHRRILEAVGTLGALADEGHVFDDLDAAIAHARLHIRRAAAAGAGAHGA